MWRHEGAHNNGYEKFLSYSFCFELSCISRPATAILNRYNQAGYKQAKATITNRNCHTNERNPAHDPVMIKQNDTYYLFVTGNGLMMYSSKDMKNLEKRKTSF